VSADDALPGGNGSAPESPSGDKRVAATETYVEMMERLAPDTRVAGRYRIVSIAGVGGMGVVYRARDEELGVDAAIKVLRRDLGSDPRVIERFRGELVLARQVSHKNVVRLHDIGEHEGIRFLTMDYVEGRSLREILENDGPFPLDRAVSIVRQVAEGLAAAHEKGIVHRDLKPGNILIDADGNAFITDFGVARSLEKSGITRAGAIVGTPDYLSPEQVSGDPVDGRTDLYALGIVFYEMLSGRLPFSGESQAEMLAQRIAGRPRDLKEAGVSAPAWVRGVLRRCLERSPARRYQSARELIEDLDSAGLGGKPPRSSSQRSSSSSPASGVTSGLGEARRQFPAAARRPPPRPLLVILSPSCRWAIKPA
jgi:eukaryotic-like serine/threonine-protein kinase